MLLHHLNLADLLTDPVFKFVPLHLELVGLCSYDVELMLDKLEEVIEPGRGAWLLGRCDGRCCWDEVAMLVDV